MNENFDAFDEFVMKYDMNDKMIEYKYNHSYRVVHQAEEICRSLNLDTETRDISSLIALLHDLARFEQWTKYKTFDDHKSFDHGLRATELLFNEGVIKKFIVNEKDYEVIKKSIFNHNQYKVDYSKMTDEEILQTKVIRDADKVDILYSFSTNRLLELVEDDGIISDKIHESFLSHEGVLKTDVTNKNEHLLMLLSLVFDLNFDYSIERVYEEGYINKIYSHLKNKKLFKPYIDDINTYLKGKMKNVRK